MQEKIKNFKELKVWQEGIVIANDVYNATKLFPKEELYTLVSQMRRSAISIPSNIAEGFKRYHKKEFKQFLHIALGSSAELETQLIISEKQQYITKEDAEKIYSSLNSLSKMTNALMRKLN